MFFVGLDVHRKFIYGTVLDNDGKVVNQGQFSTTERDFDNFLGFLPNELPTGAELRSIRPIKE